MGEHFHVWKLSVVGVSGEPDTFSLGWLPAGITDKYGQNAWTKAKRAGLEDSFVRKCGGGINCPDDWRPEGTNPSAMIEGK